MKKLFLIPALFCLFMLNVASMCSSDDNSSSSQDPTPVINTATQGTWRITSYVDSGTDETNHFTGYNFTFASGNVLTATNGTNTYTGTWSVTNDNSNDDNPSSDLDFNIGFTSPANFADLTDDWDIVSYTSTTISLIDISGGNGGTDILVFTKN
ncbi:hypothetical protein [Flavobacterium sedimenticola]|uniref:Lipocalin-like domain-containing protein n=1 Tax=Flavobacterium sedimenticola TaxID=3043286 RepID=A0ABT6XQP6_9FLAO|nr:hypothetical protein [Flavobacterium sedimenticola]MDI9257386.1 hypothetical protein [Flavobacterium sedimenticola]